MRTFYVWCLSIFVHGSRRIHQIAQGKPRNDDTQYHENDAYRIVNNESTYEPQDRCYDRRQYESASFFIHKSPYKLSVVSERALTGTVRDNSAMLPKV